MYLLFSLSVREMKIYGKLNWGPKQEENTDEAAIAVPGAAEEENVNEEYECISGLLDELGDQMGR